MFSSISPEILITGIAVALLLSVTVSKISERLGVPALLLFLVIGMLAGSEMLGGIYFDDARMAQTIGVIALSFILFAGGLETDILSIRPILKQGISLSTLGVFITALAVGIFVSQVLSFSLLEGLLLGSIVASTDAAAVFAVLRSKNVSLKGRIRPLLEMESGSNDPMAVFFTIGFISLILHPEKSWLTLLPMFFIQFALGGALGVALGKAGIYLINKIKLDYEGLYPVLTIALTMLTYGITTWLGGSGFLAVYCAGLTMANPSYVHKKSLIRFHDGLAWLMQISMFLVLGLLIFPQQLLPVVSKGIVVSLFLIFAARPLSVFISMAFSGFSFKEKVMVSWVGLRGAVPIVLATFPLLAGVERASTIFNLVFFIVIVSVLLQGTTIPWVAKLLKLEAPLSPKRRFPIEFEYGEGVDMNLIELIVPYESKAVGMPIFKLGLPKESLVALICREDKFIVPSGDTVLDGGDVLLTLSNEASLPKVRDAILKTHKQGGQTKKS